MIYVRQPLRSFFIMPICRRASLPSAPLLPPLDEHVPKRHDGRVEQHARAAVAHSFADFFTHLGRVAVRPARTAKRLCLHVRAALDTRTGIIEQRFTFFAKAQIVAMMRAAVDFEHFLDRRHLCLALFLCCHTDDPTPLFANLHRQCGIHPHISRSTDKVETAPTDFILPVLFICEHYSKVDREKQSLYHEAPRGQAEGADRSARLL